MTRSAPTLAILVSAAFLAFHLPYLPTSLEDLDSINFALGLRRFDVAQHRPHPPGYPVFIALVKTAHLGVSSVSARLKPRATNEPRATSEFVTEATSLSVVGIVAGSAAVFPLIAIFRKLQGDEAADALPIAAAVVAVTCPLYWFTASRPLSDMTGLTAALAVQALIVMATDAWALALASFCAAVGIGIRSQVFWLTAPLLVMTMTRWRRPAEAGGYRAIDRVDRQVLIGVPFGFLVGLLAWGIPLVVLTGGLAAYWRALFSQGSEDLSGVRMLWTEPTVRQMARALDSAFVSPWAVPWVASVVIVAALWGARRMIGDARASLATIAVAFGPYLLFDLLFHEDATTRYALPLVVPMAYLAVRGVAAIGSRTAVVFAVLLAMFDAHVGGTSIAAYAKQPAPAFRLLDDMRAAADRSHVAPVLAMDRREDLDLRRPIQWVGDRMPALSRRLPAPPQREWLELVKYWNESGRLPVWFLADPKRTDVMLVDRGEPTEYRWRLPYPTLIGGVRPDELDWYRLVSPDWYLGEGWALTPEAAGIATADRVGPELRPIEGWISVRTFDRPLIIGGRNLAGSGRPARLTMKIGEVAEPVIDAEIPPGPFLRLLRVPTERSPERDYLKVTVAASPGSHIAIEQFDTSSDRVVFGFGDGWHEPEYNPAVGLHWRWLSERGDLHLARIDRPIVLHLEGESPLKYFPRSSRLVIRDGGRVLLDQLLSSDFTADATIAPSAPTENERILTLETDQTYIPAERSRRAADRRHLGLRIFRCAVHSLG